MNINYFNSIKVRRTIRTLTYRHTHTRHLLDCLQCGINIDALDKRIDIIDLFVEHYSAMFSIFPNPETLFIVAIIFPLNISKKFNRDQGVKS